jgi:DUF2917 family protein
MRIHAVHAAISLEPEQTLRIESHREVEIGCLSGLVWITQPGDPRDLFVAAGQSVQVAPSGLTLVTAIQPALLRAGDVASLAGMPAWRRWWERPALPSRVQARIGRL